MTTQIRFLGFASYEITNSRGTKVLIDPYLDDNPVSPLRVVDLERVDLILVTHLAFDHLGDTVHIAKKFGCPVVCGGEVKHYLSKQSVNPGQVRAVSWGVQVLEAGLRVRSITSMHSSMTVDEGGNLLFGLPMGFILTADPGVRIYHSGDTTLFGDLRLIGELYRPNIGLISCCQLDRNYLEEHGIYSTCGNKMNGDEGALAALWLRLEYALCNHYLQAEGSRDVEKFVAILNSRTSDDQPVVRPIVLNPGEIFVYPPSEK